MPQKNFVWGIWIWNLLFETFFVAGTVVELEGVAIVAVDPCVFPAGLFSLSSEKRKSNDQILKSNPVWFSNINSYVYILLIYIGDHRNSLKHPH